ncbi:MAG: activator of (R)-2-hydroxyglutaryl-CoA dehydratase [FCB group bacterium]|jgi:predicted nucleotide-binding protein (sugar kinase/HSP70/actin superfamily)|nr:activator of (R)-2-hydroxyglutaryl-CoA dehydratase [FCB group bacterium]
MESVSGTQTSPKRRATVRHYRRPVERPFTRDERERVTLLFGGLTKRHEVLIQAAVEGLGYTVAILPTPGRPDYCAGREYCNKGQCNPSYFTVGALINYLKNLRDEQGLSVESILDNYVMITAGSCGPCRFGMYESEYRLGLRNSGFDGFRVILFAQRGLNQSGPDAGLEFNVPFFVGIINSVLIGDLLNEVACHIRPYEVVPGQTERVMRQVVERLQDVLRVKPGQPPRERLLTTLLGILLPRYTREDRGRFVEQLIGREYVEALKDCARIIDEGIEVDYTRPKPVCKIIGEFWAQTTEGDGNFRMFSFLESQGAEIRTEPIMSWADYVIGQERARLKDRRGLDESGNVPRGLAGKMSAEVRRHWQRSRMRFAAMALHREFERNRVALGGTAHALLDQEELQRLADPYYNRRATGGEGHLEVAKNIYYAQHKLAHMVLSLKPFGCLPSTQSDGVQAAVTARFPDTIFVPIETSGENEIGAYSRVQMALGEAKGKCREEFAACVAETGYTLENIHAFCAEHRELRRPLQDVPFRKGVAGRAANFVAHVGRLMDADPGWSRRKVRR